MICDSEILKWQARLNEKLKIRFDIFKLELIYLPHEHRWELHVGLIKNSFVIIDMKKIKDEEYIEQKLDELIIIIRFIICKD